MIEFKDISLKFEDKTLFDSFNLKVGEGEKILLSSPSGSGKSTLFKMLLGFTKPDQGEIIFEGNKLDKNSLRNIRKNISYVSQDVDLRNEILGNLIEEIFNYGANKNIGFSQEKLKELLEYFKLNEDILKKNIKEISGGERQRVGLIISMLLDREVWLLDEVTSGLDKELKEKVMNYIANSNKTVIIISHDNLWLENDTFRIVRW